MPRSASLALSVVAIFSFSAFLSSSSLVRSLTARWASMALCVCARPRASTIWLFHRGMVLFSEVWIFSAISWLLDWIRRICGAIWMETLRVNSRS